MRNISVTFVCIELHYGIKTSELGTWPPSSSCLVYSSRSAPLDTLHLVMTTLFGRVEAFEETAET